MFYLTTHSAHFIYGYMASEPLLRVHPSDYHDSTRMFVNACGKWPVNIYISKIELVDVGGGGGGGVT